MSYDNALSAEEKQALQTLLNMARADAGQLFAKLGNHGRAITAQYSGNVENILAKLGGSDLIPNTSGLAGAQAMTKDETVNLFGYFITESDPTDNASGSFNTNYHRSLFAKAGGAGNLLG